MSESYLRGKIYELLRLRVQLLYVEAETRRVINQFKRDLLKAERRRVVLQMAAKTPKNGLTIYVHDSESDDE